MKNEHSMVKHQIEGSNDDDILRFCYPRKADETRNPMKSKSNNLDLRSGRNLCLKISKNLNPILAKIKNNSIHKMKLKWFVVTK